MSYSPDPGGRFASDTHRRTQGHLPLPDDSPMSAEALLERMNPDPYTDLNDTAELGDVLMDLEASGYAAQVGGDWVQTTEGLAVLSGPNAEG